MNKTNITIKEYLSEKGFLFRESGKELITKCFFSGCDDDSHGSEAHLYFNAENGQYECKKCGEKGNLITLQKYFGDITPQKKSLYSNGPRFNDSLVEKCHQNLPTRIREYLIGRGIANEIINNYKLGYGDFYGKKYITIPIAGENGYKFFKLRQDPSQGDSKITYPKGAEAQLFGSYGEESQIICEGEFDALSLISKGLFAITSTHGAGTFKEEWIDEKLKKLKTIYVCFDNDEAGQKGSLRVLKLLDDAEIKNLFHITLPEEIGEHGDITDYLTKLKFSVEDLLNKYSKPYPEKIDTSQFKPMNASDIARVLDLTIKNDDDNKITTLLCYISAFTEDSQINVSFNSPSSTGKSYTALEVAKLFPEEDVIKLGNCSKTAFFHEQGKYDKEKNEIVVDLSRKILIFTDMPHVGLLEGLRSFLSHDEKIMRSKITDKSQQGGNRTKTVALKGFPSVIFCTAGLKMDPQEMTRFILLSPEVNQEKIKAGITNTILKEADNEKYRDWLENDPDRKLLKLRIQAIKQEKIGDIRIANYEEIERRFFDNDRVLQPRHQRDIKRLLSIIKSFALNNLWWRERDGHNVIIANDDDIKEGFNLWDRISVSQELNIPPYVYELYTQVFVPAFNEKNKESFEFDLPPDGITRAEILQKHFQVFQRRINVNSLRFDILPTLESAGLISRERDKEDARKEVVFITEFKSVSELENNSEQGCGVEKQKSENTEMGRGITTDEEDY